MRSLHRKSGVLHQVPPPSHLETYSVTIAYAIVTGSA
jgi:hypothetical protein